MDIPQIDNSAWGKFRDRLTWVVCNFMLSKVATPWYSGMIDGSIRLGMETAKSDNPPQH